AFPNRSHLFSSSPPIRPGHWRPLHASYPPLLARPIPPFPPYFLPSLSLFILVGSTTFSLSGLISLSSYILLGDFSPLLFNVSRSLSITPFSTSLRFLLVQPCVSFLLVLSTRSASFSSILLLPFCSSLSVFLGSCLFHLLANSSLLDPLFSLCSPPRSCSPPSFLLVSFSFRFFVLPLSTLALEQSSSSFLLTIHFLYFHFSLIAALLVAIAGGPRARIQSVRKTRYHRVLFPVLPTRLSTLERLSLSLPIGPLSISRYPVSHQLRSTVFHLFFLPPLLDLLCRSLCFAYSSSSLLRFSLLHCFFNSSFLLFPPFLSVLLISSFQLSDSQLSLRPHSSLFSFLLRSSRTHFHTL
ncbi:uncharacterized protein LOC118648251, partial [Monomorium pharaonis]|uniref:uncharacterized protein LOC118648251 n=1 Tax=Monomorium pharaonis TaxID=307658 RepID=UPI00174667EA